MPWALEGQSVGAQLLERGQGPARTTAVLLDLVDTLTAVKLDPALAAALTARLGVSAKIVVADAADIGSPSAASFDTVITLGDAASCTERSNPGGVVR